MLNFKQVAKLKNKAKQNRISFSVLNNVSVLILAANFSFENSVLCLHFSQILQNLFTANLTGHTLHSIIFGHQRNLIYQRARIMWYELHIAYFHQFSILDVYFEGQIDIFVFWLAR